MLRAGALLLAKGCEYVLFWNPISETWRWDEMRREACGRLGSPAEPCAILDKIVAALDQDSPAVARGGAPAVLPGSGANLGGAKRPGLQNPFRE